MADFDSYGALNNLSSLFRSSVKASAPVGDDDLGYFVHVNGMEPEELAGLVLAYYTDKPSELAQLAAAAIAALVLRDYEQMGSHAT